jgi:aspartokinase
VETEVDEDAPSPVQPTEAEEVLQQKRDALAFFTENNPEKVEQIAQLKQEIAEMEAAPPTEESVASPASIVNYFDGDGAKKRANIPAGALTSKGEAVSEDNVAEWLSEQGETVQSINAFKQGKAKPSRSGCARSGAYNGFCAD